MMLRATAWLYNHCITIIDFLTVCAIQHIHILLLRSWIINCIDAFHFIKFGVTFQNGNVHQMVVGAPDSIRHETSCDNKSTLLYNNGMYAYTISVCVPPATPNSE